MTLTFGGCDTEQIFPIFTKQGCNSGGCHGKASGQNGFRLSLLGFEPALAYEALVKEARGRRLFPAAPDQSLLLLKGAARLPHGGGKRLDPHSSEYRLIRRWIALGMPTGTTSDPTLARIEVHPSGRVMPRGKIRSSFWSPPTSSSDHPRATSGSSRTSRCR